MRWFDGRDAAEAFVAARIENVMAFEKWKAGKDFDAPLRKVPSCWAAVSPRTESTRRLVPFATVRSPACRWSAH